MKDIQELSLRGAISRTARKSKTLSYEEQKMWIIVKAVLANEGNYIRAAEELQTNRNTIARWMNKFRKYQQKKTDLFEGHKGMQNELEHEI